MTKLGDIVWKTRTKNAGPFWLTVDIFCGSPEAFERVSKGLASSTVARAFKTDPQELKRFDITYLNVVKFSLPRPTIQGTVADRDMHGASFALIIDALEI